MTPIYTNLTILSFWLRLCRAGTFVVIAADNVLTLKTRDDNHTPLDSTMKLNEIENN